MIQGGRMSRRARIAVAVVATTFLALAGTTTASATWTTSSTASASVTAGSATMTLGYASGAPSLTSIFTATSTPSISTLTLANTGSVPLNYALSVTATPGAVAPLAGASVGLAVWNEASCTSPTNWGTLAAPPALPVGLASAVGPSSATMCVATRLDAAYASSRGRSIAVALKVIGTVGTSAWTANATVSFTDSVRVGDVTALTCGTSLYNLLSTQATLSWTAVAGTGVTYSIVYATGGARVTPNATTATSATIRYENLTASSNALLVMASDSFGSVSAGVPITLTRSTLLNLGTLIYSVGCP